MREGGEGERERAREREREILVGPQFLPGLLEVHIIRQARNEQ